VYAFHREDVPGRAWVRKLSNETRMYSTGSPWAEGNLSTYSSSS